MRQRLRKLSPEKNVERYLDQRNHSRLEDSRRALDMEGWMPGAGAPLAVAGANIPGREDVRTIAGAGVVRHDPAYVRLPSDPGKWSPDHPKPLLDSKDGERYYRRRASYIRDGMKTQMQNARREFALRLDALGGTA